MGKTRKKKEYAKSYFRICAFSIQRTRLSRSRSLEQANRIVLCTNDVTNFWSLLWLRHWTWSVTRSLSGKVTFPNNFSSSLKIFIVNRNKIQLGFDYIYPEEIVKHGELCTDKWFFFLMPSIAALVWVRLYVTAFSKLCAVWNLPGRRTKLNITNLHNFRIVLMLVCFPT